MLSMSYHVSSYIVFMLITTLFSLSDKSAKDVRLRFIFSTISFVVFMYLFSRFL